MSRKILIIAGPNGAGKTTFAREYLPNEAACDVFVNADLIAAGLSPFRPASAAIEAGRLMLRQIDTHARLGRSFAFETTLAGHNYARRIRDWQANGFRVKLIFLALENPAEAIARVAGRVSQGGHAIPEAVIRRRFEAGLRNFRNVYRHEVDCWQQFNASGPDSVLESEGGLAMKKREYKIPVSKLPDRDMRGAPAALMRALRRAHWVAHQTGTGVIVMRDGEVVEIEPDPELYEGFVPTPPLG